MTPGMNLISSDSDLDQYSNLDITQKVMDEFSQNSDSKANWVFMNMRDLDQFQKKSHNSNLALLFVV